MWQRWLQRTAPPGEPRCWWSQLAGEARPGLPFAHLFPRPPEARRSPASEAEQLVRTLRREVAAPEARSGEPRPAPLAPPPPPPPTRARRVAERWGTDGELVQAWFAKGEAEAEAPRANLEGAEELEPRGLRGLLSRWRRRLERPAPEAWAGAEI